MNNNDSTMTLVFNKDKGERLFYFKMLESKEQIPSYFKYCNKGKFLYVYELNGNHVFGSCESKNLEAMVSYATGCVGILGPIRDIETVISEVESLIFDFKVGENFGTYHFDNLTDFTGIPNGILGIFQWAQCNYRDGWKDQKHFLHSLDEGALIRDLIIPDKQARVNVVTFETIDGVEHGSETVYSV